MPIWSGPLAWKRSRITCGDTSSACNSVMFVSRKIFGFGAGIQLLILEKWKKGDKINAWFFYWSKMILDCPNCFGQVQIILVRFKLVDLSRLFFIFWTCPKWLGPNQFELDPTKTNSKTIVTRLKLFGRFKNPFGHIEGQGKSQCLVLL